MKRRNAALQFLFAVLLIANAFLGASSAEEPKDGIQTDKKTQNQRLDIYGDPLPPGAVARFGSLRLKHSQPGVNAVCYSADAKMIASGGEDRTVRLWEAETGKLIHVFEGHRFPVTSVAISPKGDMLASGSERGGLMVWNLKDYSVLYEDSVFGRGEMKLSFSPDGASLAAVDQSALLLIRADLLPRTKRIDIRHFRPFWSAWSPDGKTIGLIGRASFERRCVLVVDAQSGEILAAPDSEPKASFPEHCSIVFSPIDATLITGDFFRNTRADYGGGLTLWKRADGKLEEIRRIAPGKSWGAVCSSLSHHPKEPMVAYFRNDLLVLHNWKTLEVIGTAVTERGTATAFSPDGRILATAGAMLRVWTVPDLKPVFKFHPDVLPVSFSKDSRQAAVGSVLWDLETHQPLYVAENAYAQMGHNHLAIRSKHFPPPNGVRIVRGEKIFSYSFNRQRLHVEDVKNRKRLVDYQALKELKPTDTFGIGYVDFSDDMERVVVRASDKEQGTRFTMIRVADGARIQQFSLLNNPNISGSHLTLSPDGRTLATMLGGEGYNLYLFDTAAGNSKHLTNFSQDRVYDREGIFFSSKGGYLALYFTLTRSYLIYSIPEGKELLSVLRPKYKPGTANPLASEVHMGEPAFPGDDQLFAVAEGDFTSEKSSSFQATISVWDLKKRKRLWTQDWGSELPRQMHFGGDDLIVAGKRLAVWDASSGRLVIEISPQEADGGLFYVTAVRSPNGKWLLAGRSDGVTELINIRSGARVGKGKLAPHNISVDSCHFAPNSSLGIVTYQDRTALLWDLSFIAEFAP